MLIIYSTTDGHTIKICERLQQISETQGHTVKTTNITDLSHNDLNSHSTIIVGASIRYGKHSPAIVRFLKQNQSLLEQKKFALFSVNVVARKEGKNTPQTNPYLQKLLRQLQWTPAILEVFAGKIDYPRYNWLDRFLIRMIMKMTKGPTDPKTVIEFTDWNRVEAFGKRIATLE